jgi:hypothetical protein
MLRSAKLGWLSISFRYGLIRQYFLLTANRGSIATTFDREGISGAWRHLGEILLMSSSPEWVEAVLRSYWRGPSSDHPGQDSVRLSGDVSEESASLPAGSFARLLRDATTRFPTQHRDVRWVETFPEALAVAAHGVRRGSRHAGGPPWLATSGHALIKGLSALPVDHP